MINMYETIIFAVFYISILFLFSSRSETRQAFVATWNVPSEVCSQKFNIEFDLKQFRIDSNKNTSFMGEEVVLFYEPLPGLYPKYLSNGSALNGGIPQVRLYLNACTKIQTELQKCRCSKLCDSPPSNLHIRVSNISHITI